jgi:hypothetical protein
MKKQNVKLENLKLMRKEVLICPGCKNPVEKCTCKPIHS